MITDEDICEIICALLELVRPYGCFFAFSAGEHRAIRGHFRFFEVKISHTGAVVNHLLELDANIKVHCVFTVK